MNVSLILSHPVNPANVMLRNVAEETFHIKARYKNDIVEEIVWKRWIYNRIFIQSLRKGLGYSIPSYVDVQRFILGTYADAEGIYKRPLTRMVQAVAKKVGVM